MSQVAGPFKKGLELLRSEQLVEDEIAEWTRGGAISS